MSSFCEVLKNEENFYNLSFFDEKILNTDIHFFCISNCQFQHCNFEHVTFKNVKFIHCTFVNCKFLTSSFFKCVMEQTKIEDCDFVNLNFIDSVFKRNQWISSLWKYVEARKDNFEVDVFEDCNFLESMILMSAFRDVVFSFSRFENSELRSGFQDSNFSTSILKNTYLDLMNLKNCILTPSQGLDLLLFYGVSFSE